MNQEPLQAALGALRNADPYAIAKARAMLTVYAERYTDMYLREYEILEVEREFNFPLLNPETEAQSRSFDEGGKMDVLMRKRATGNLAVNEHKTTSDSVESDSDYWDRLRLDVQCSKYYLAAAQMNLGDVECVLYDVLHKPGQRPSFVADVHTDGFKIVLDKDGKRVYTANGKKPRETADAEKGYVLQGHIERPAEYESRLLGILRAEPGKFFAQREVARLDSDILEYMGDAWATSQTILYFRKNNLWPRNAKACDEMGTCEMFDLCTGRACVDSIRYRVRDCAHPELKMQSGNGRELLTTSRTHAFNRCRCYHKLKYEDRIEKCVEDNEALTFGTLVHAGLEAFFLCLKKIQPFTLSN